ncbi:MAG: hypothetical protein HRT35_17885 [Algicola sp.]|nr:hypothetical protein [Algicola sp.]
MSIKTLSFKWLCSVSMVFLSLLGSSNARAGGGFFDFNFYPYLSDVDTDSAFTLNIAKKLPKRFSYFSLTNVYSTTGDDYLSDSLLYYTEQNLRWQVADDSPFDLTLQMNFRSGSKNNRHRLGVRWRLNNTPALAPFFKSLNLSYSINLHAIQFDHEDATVWQMEHVLMMKFPSISNRLYLAAFLDHTFNQNLPSGMPKNPIVAEMQLGVRLVDSLYFISEFRLNQYRRSDVNNLAIGLQYKKAW